MTKTRVSDEEGCGISTANGLLLRNNSLKRGVWRCDLPKPRTEKRVRSQINTTTYSVAAAVPEGVKYDREGPEHKGGGGYLSFRSI